MANRREKGQSARRAARLAALTSPVRIELIGALQAHGPSSVRELAAHLGRPADGLYHHIRTLEKAGVLREESRRKVGRREEAVYALTAARIGGEMEPNSRASREAAGRAAAAALRLAAREFAAALLAGEAPCAGDVPRLRTSRQKAWLTDAGLGELHALLSRVEELLSGENERRQGRLFVLTTVLTPLIQRKRV
jgi:DNA-binding transcriptional ArsR family regulator